MPKKQRRPDIYRCAKTGKQGKPTEMLRFVLAPNGSVVFDAKADLPARQELWLTSEKQVLKEAIQSGLFKKMFGEEARVPNALIARTEEQVLERVQNWLALARKGGHLLAGQTKVEQAFLQEKVKLWLCADDAGDDGTKQISKLAEGIECSAWLTRDELGQPLGRPFMVHAVVTDGSLKDRICQEMRRLAGFRQKDAL